MTFIYIYIYIYIYIANLLPNSFYSDKEKDKILKRCRKYRANVKDCMFCNEEKLAIASYSCRDMLNQRSEILNDCKHKRSWLLYN